MSEQIDITKPELNIKESPKQEKLPDKIPDPFEDPTADYTEVIKAMIRDVEVLIAVDDIEKARDAYKELEKNIKKLSPAAQKKHADEMSLLKKKVERHKTSLLNRMFGKKK